MIKNTEGVVMPVCKHCGVRISKFDADRCPICGELNPLKDVKSDTIEVTSEINLSSHLEKDYRPVKRKVFLILSILIGWTGTPWFYAHDKKKGLIHLLINLLVFGVFFAILFPTTKNLLLALIIPTSVLYVVNTVFGVVIMKNPSFKDGNGNLLR